jgi:TonB-linked SusC/RagA family outer membrane protein
MVEDDKSLNTVVVVGYGSQSKAKVTGAIATIKMDDVLGDRPVSTVSALLQGTVPGLQSTINSGQPGASTSLNVRGATDLNTSGNSVNAGGPLILVDNVPFNGGLNLIDPNDIETLTVLKDAGSAAIYGGRSAFGVILITSKKGKFNQKTQFNYSNNIVFANAANLPVKATPGQFLQSLKDMGTVGYWSGQNVDTWIQLYNDAQANPNKYPNGVAVVGSAYYPVKAGEVLHDYIGNSVPQFQHNFSVSGGSDKTTYRFSFGSINENGILVPSTHQDKFTRYNLKSFISTDISSWFTTQLDAGYYNSKTSVPATNLFANAADFSPLVPTADTITASSGITGINGTPKGITLNSAPNTTQNNDIRVTGRGILKPLKGLTITGEYTYDNLKTDQVNYSKLISIVRPTNFQVQPNGTGTYGLVNGTLAYKAINIFGNYTKSFSKHNFSVLVGYNQEESIANSNSVSRNGMIAADQPSLSQATGPINASDTYSAFSLKGYFGRINYDYDNKYLVQVNGRYDGSSKFPENHRYGFFPSASVGWVVSQENFMKEHLPAITQLKVRASLGSVGNQNINPYAFIPTMNSIQPQWLNGTGAYLTSLSTPGLISSNFTWETVTTLDYGVDFGFLKNRLNGSFDWYRRDTKDILAAGAIPLPAVLGTGAPLQNTASLRSTGFEATVNWSDKIGKNIRYHISANLYDSKAAISKFDGNPNNLLNTYYVGQQVGEIYGYTTDRFYTASDFVDGSLKTDLTGGTLKSGVPKFQGQNPNPGDILYKDLNKDGVVYQGTLTKSDPGDRSIIGNSSPRYQFGLNGGISFKGLEFSFVLRGVGKRSYFLVNNLTFPDYSGFTTVYAHTLNYWTPTNANAFYGRIYDQAAGNQSFNQLTQTRFLQNGAYLQVSNLGLSYAVPNNLIGKMNLAGLRFFASVENPIMFSHLPKGLDPSLSDQGSGLGYPFLRRTSFGASLTF